MRFRWIQDETRTFLYWIRFTVLDVDAWIRNKNVPFGRVFGDFKSGDLSEYFVSDDE